MPTRGRRLFKGGAFLKIGRDAKHVFFNLMEYFLSLRISYSDWRGFFWLSPFVPSGTFQFDSESTGSRVGEYASFPYESVHSKGFESSSLRISTMVWCKTACEKLNCSCGAFSGQCLLEWIRWYSICVQMSRILHLQRHNLYHVSLVLKSAVIQPR